MKFIAPLLIFTLVLPTQLFAEPPTQPDISPTPKIRGITKGDPAPFSGVLLNPAAAARLFTDENYSNEECKLRIDFEVRKEFLRMKLLLDSTTASMNAMEGRYNSIITIKDKEIDKLNAIALESSNDYNTWWAAGGILTGIALTLAVLFAAKEI